MSIHWNRTFTSFSFFLWVPFFNQMIVTTNAFRIFQREIAAHEIKNVKGLTYSYSNDAYKPSEVSWEEIPYKDLKLLDELGSGAFGVVYKGEYLQDNGNVLPCAVKSLKRESGIPHLFLFMFYSSEYSAVQCSACSAVHCRVVQGRVRKRKAK